MSLKTYILCLQLLLSCRNIRNVKQFNGFTVMLWEKKSVLTFDKSVSVKKAEFSHFYLINENIFKFFRQLWTKGNHLVLRIMSIFMCELESICESTD